jgi:hypothetical protein
VLDQPGLAEGFLDRLDGRGRRFRSGRLGDGTLLLDGLLGHEIFPCFAKRMTPSTGTARRFAACQI